MRSNTYRYMNNLIFQSRDCNLVFNKGSGVMMPCGKTFEESSSYSSVGLELLDIEISTVCSNNCSHCYKSNSSSGKNMTLSEFIAIMYSIPTDALTQIDIGIGDINANPDLYKILAYCRSIGIPAGITINGKGLSEEGANNLACLCKSVGVSCYDKDDCYNAVAKLTSFGLEQVLVHLLVSEETYSHCLSVLQDIKSDPRLQKLFAVLFLSLKRKGRGASFHQLSLDKYNQLIKTAIDSKIRFRADTCSAHMLTKVFNDEFSQMMIHSCDAARSSMYINCEGKAYPCSFLEDGPGLDVVGNDFSNIWFSKEFKLFRRKLINRKEVQCLALMKK